MKILFTSILFLLFAVTCFSQIDYGVRLGLNFNPKSSVNVSNIPSVESSYENSAGFNAGFFLKSKLPFIGFFIQPELLYNYKKIPLNLDNTNADITQQSLHVPILFGQKILLFNWYLGPVLFVNLSSKSNFNNMDLSNDYKRINASGLIGVGVEVWKFMVDVRCQLGFSKFKSTIGNFNVDQSDNFLNLSIAYKF